MPRAALGPLPLTRKQRIDLVESLRAGAEALEDRNDCNDCDPVRAARDLARARRLRRYAEQVEAAAKG